MLIRYVDERVRTLKKDRTAADYQVKQLCNGLRIEENYLVNTSVRKNEEDLLKIRSDVFETNDNEYIKDIFQYDTSTFLKPNFTIRPSLRVIRKHSRCCGQISVIQLSATAYLVFFCATCNRQE